MTMSESNAQPQPKTARTGQGDGRVLAHVEKWMAMIREIAREQATQS
jgi:hypothetical protein